MSPRNNRSCPQCEAIKEAKILAFQAQLQDLYGKVPLSDFEKLQRYIEKKESERDNCTLAEYYCHAYRFDDGKFVDTYSATCDVCGFSFSNRFETPVIISTSFEGDLVSCCEEDQ